MQDTMSVTVIGLGYVGIVTAACLSSRGILVYCHDINPEKLSAIRNGVSPIYEPGLEDLLRNAVMNGRLRVVEDPAEGISRSSYTIITVGTPSLSDGSADLSQVFSAAETIGKCLRSLNQRHVVVLRSTVPPGTTIGPFMNILESFSGKKCGLDFGLCFNPEFLREGSAVEDTLNPDRIVIGCIDQKSGEELLSLYRALHQEQLPPVIMTTPTSAELIKYANNAFLAMKISFINMISRLCEKLPGGNVDEVAAGIGADKRIGPYFLKAGLGWGGSCFPKDLRALRRIFLEAGLKPHLIDATIEINDGQVEWVCRLLERELSTLSGKRIAILGAAFKEFTDDVRESQAIRLANRLLNSGASISIFDPAATINVSKVLDGKVDIAKSIDECLENADAAVIATPWPVFRSLTPEKLREKMKGKIIIDARRIIDPKLFESSEFRLLILGSYMESRRE
ncbi:MAG: UDP-glucose/GDP-mannose dehydrogenase family protein [Nitrososphaerota archaeon]